MKIFSRLTVALLMIASIALAGCTGTAVQVGTPAERVDLSAIDFSKGRKVTGAASGFQLLLLIPISLNSRHDRAYTALLAQAGGDYVTDIAVTESWAWGFVGTVYTTTIEGMAYPEKK